MSNINVGDRVEVQGIQARPQLNGMFGTVTGRAPNGRLNVRLENIEQETVALKPANLTTVGSSGGGSGGGGGGGGGGFGSRVPGVAGLLAAATQMAEQLRDQVRMMVPHPQVHMMLDQMSTNQLLGGLAVGVAAGMHFLSGWVPWKVLIVLVALALFLTQHGVGKRLLSAASARATELSGRHITESQVLMAICLAVALAGRTFLGSPSGGGGGGGGGTGGAAGGSRSGNTAESVTEAYAKGYEDGKAGNKYDAPKYVPPEFDDDYEYGRGSSSSSSSGSGGFGIWSLMRYMYLGQGACVRQPSSVSPLSTRLQRPLFTPLWRYCCCRLVFACAAAISARPPVVFSIYRMGGGGSPTGFSPPMAIAGLKANPMQAVMAAMMLSNMIF
jgi:hypothetical protein